MREGNAREVLGSLINTVPSKLLAELADATFNALSLLADTSPEIAPLERMAYGLLSLLLSSDSPQIATDLILRAIIERPDASSWHRAILNVGLARKLPAQQAQALLSSFATSIGLNLEEQAKLAGITTVEDASRNPSSRLKPIIKITTVKYLAQILNNADFVVPSFTVDVLSKLLSSASHLDVRVAVVDSLVGMLRQCTEEYSTPLAQRLLLALETVIPLVSDVSERRLMREEDWADAERTGVPPAVYHDVDMQSLPPILDLLLKCNLQESKWRHEIVNRILLSIIERSRESNARWIKIFLVKHQLSSDLSGLPVFPIKPLMLSQLLSQWNKLVPASVLDLRQQFVLANIAPSEGIASINDKVGSDGDLRASNAGRHWLSMYGNGTNAYRHGQFSLAKTLCREWKRSKVLNGIQILQVQRSVLEQAESLLKLSDHSFNEWTTFVRDLEPPLGINHRDEDKEAWVTNAKPVLERIIAGIDSLRTSAWQRDQQREPTVLPPTVPLRLWLLSYPCLPSASATDIDDKCKVFAEELSVFVDEILARGTAYHEDLQHVLAAASRAQSEHKAWIACQLGSVPRASSPISSATLLRVELAERLFKGAKPPRESAGRDAVKEILALWTGSECEEIRMKGFSVTQQLRQVAAGERSWGMP